MLQFIDTADDVFAAIVSDKITSADLTALMDRLEPQLATHEKVHVFVETRSIDGIEVSGLLAYIARALPLFGKLRKFDRVAVVADQGWVRAGTRAESVLVPFVSYRTFLPEQRDEALAWVEGGAE